MINSFDTDGILYRLLNNATSIKGQVYVGDTRDENSLEEDIVVNTLDLEFDALPQVGTSNVNIYAVDIDVNINGQMQRQANRARLNEVVKEVEDIIRNAKIEGLKAYIKNISYMYEQNTHQHFANIRVDWNIQTENSN